VETLCYKELDFTSQRKYIFTYVRLDYDLDLDTLIAGTDENLIYMPFISFYMIQYRRNSHNLSRSSSSPSESQDLNEKCPEGWQSKIPPSRSPKTTTRFLPPRCAMEGSYRQVLMLELGSCQEAISQLVRVAYQCGRLIELT